MNKTLTNKILITLAFLFAYRILAYVPVPGVNVNVIKEFFDSNSSNALGLFNMFSGKAAERLSIISLGIMPYITASIIMELLAATFPNLGKMKKDRDGMQKYMQIIRYATIVTGSVGVSRSGPVGSGETLSPPSPSACRWPCGPSSSGDRRPGRVWPPGR